MPSAAPEKPQVSFVVMCYNTERFAGECIQSILDLKGGYSWEIVAVDDCSLDATAEVIARFKDTRIRFIRHAANRGPQQSAFDGLQAARGQYIARMDSDDRYRPGFLDRLLPIIERYPEVGLVYGDAAMIDPEGAEVAPGCDSQHGGRDFKGNELVALLEKNFICNPTVLARRECWKSVLPFPKHMVLCDWYTSVNIAREWEFYYVNDVIADYRVHPGNIHNHIVGDGSEEKSIFWLLDRVFASPETNAGLEAAKRRARGRIHGANYRRLANKYFGAGMYADARRCYWQSVRYTPHSLLHADLQRRLLGAYLGRNTYERLKTRLRPLRDLSRTAQKPL